MLFLCANLTELCYCLQEGSNKDLMGNRGVSLSSISLIQPMIQITLTGLTLMCSQKSISDELCDVRSQDRYSLLVISLASALSIYTVNSALLALPMAIVIVVLGTIPFISAILARFLLSESIDWLTVFAMLVSFGAITLLAQAEDKTH